MKKLGKNLPKRIDKQLRLMYNNICATEWDAHFILVEDSSVLWRNTQEAEEAPLLLSLIHI